MSIFVVPSSTQRGFSPARRAFTLVELLIVVSIIAILSAVAVPNFLDAQVRAKVSRARADLRSIATAAEAYAMDAGCYPAGYRTAPLWGLMALSTPVGYLVDALPPDPFFRYSSTVESRSYDYEAVSTNQRFLETPARPWNDDPTEPGKRGLKPVGFVMLSRGPDRNLGFLPENIEYDLSKRFSERTGEPGPWLATIYDPTNGAMSVGNVLRIGGQTKP